ncbi:MAG: carbohydrate ABC transporter substrate-binding protein, partial [Spirochaetaceae bacterium]
MRKIRLVIGLAVVLPLMLFLGCAREDAPASITLIQNKPEIDAMLQS